MYIVGIVSFLYFLNDEEVSLLYFIMTTPENEIPIEETAVKVLTARKRFFNALILAAKLTRKDLRFLTNISEK